MKYLKLLFIPVILPVYLLFFLLSSCVKALSLCFIWVKRLPEVFSFISVFAAGILGYYDYTHNNFLKLRDLETNELIIRGFLYLLALVICFFIGIQLCRFIRFLVLKIISLLDNIEDGFMKCFYFFHRYIKITFFDIKNKKYAFSDYNVYKIEDIDTYKYEIIKKDNKNYIYPLILTTKEDSTQ